MDTTDTIPTHPRPEGRSYPDFIAPGAPSSPPPPTGETRSPWSWAGPTVTPPAPTFGTPTSPPPPPAGGARPPARRPGRIAGLVALALLAGATGGVVSDALGDRPSATVPAASSGSGPEGTGVGISRQSSRIAGDTLDVAGIIEKAEPAVVALEVQYGNGGFGAGRGAGTGVVLTSDGDILTNAHVVENASTIRVFFVGDPQSRTARLVGTDSEADLALLHLDGASGLATAELGKSSEAQVGDDVVAIGNALALKGGPSVTKGIISALDRTLAETNGAITGLIQTDASISSGNSGGPLVNAAGQVIGINTAVATGGGRSSAENIGFAIPIDKALPIVERLRDGGAAPDAAYLGVRSIDGTGGNRGASLVTVEAGSPAAAAGLQPGDLVTHVAGKAVAGAAELGGVIQEYKPGAQVDLSVIRDGQKVTVPVTLAAR